MADLSYSPSVQSEPLPGRAAPRFPDEASPAAYGSAIGQGLENAGGVATSVFKEREAVADHAMAVAQAQAKQTQLANAHNQLQSLSLSLTHDPNTGAFTKQGQNAFGLNEQYLPQWDQGAADILKSIPDPEARAAAQQAAGQMKNQLSEQLDTHELAAHNQFADQTDLSSVHIAQQAGPANYNHPDILATNHDTIGVSLANMAQRKGWSEEQLDQAKQEAYSKFHTDVIDRMATDGKFPMAQHYLDANKGDMDANTAWSAQRMLTGELKQKENEAKQGIADKYQDSLQAAQYGLKNPITVTRAEMNVLYPKDAQRHWDGLQMVAASASQAQEFDKLKPDEIQAKVDAAKPTEGGPEAAFQISSYEVLARAAQQSMKARTQDPAQFAIDNKSWAPLDLSNVNNALQGISQRARTQGEISDQQGISTPILSKTEAKGFTDWIAKQSPSDRVQTLQQLRHALPDDASYTSLLKTVAPGSPLTAIAGATLDRPSKNDQPSWYDPNKFGAAPDVGQRILEGEEILKDKGEKGIKTKFPMPPFKTGQGASGLDSAWQSALGGNTDVFRGRPDLQQAMQAAYESTYAADASKQGKSDGVLDNDIALKAAKDVIGNVGTYGSTKVVVPNGMDPSRFEGAINQASSAALLAAGYGASDVKALRGYGLRELGDGVGTGRYVIINGNGDPLKDKAKEKTVVIDLNQQFKGPDAPPPAASAQPSTAFAGKGGSSIGTAARKLYAQAADAVDPLPQTMSGLITGERPTRAAALKKELGEPNGP